MAVNIPNDHKIYKHSKALQNIPKLGFWACKYVRHLATLYPIRLGVRRPGNTYVKLALENGFVGLKLREEST
jgi:hypothetical protein